MDGFEYVANSDILVELTNLVSSKTVTKGSMILPSKVSHPGERLSLEVQVSMYVIDNILRRSKALLETKDHSDASKVYVSSALAEKYSIVSGGLANIFDGSKSINVPVYIKEGLATNTVLFPIGYKGKNMTISDIEIKKYVAEGEDHE